jgi:hypothetical protein
MVDDDDDAPPPGPLDVMTANLFLVVSSEYRAHVICWKDAPQRRTRARSESCVLRRCVGEEDLNKRARVQGDECASLSPTAGELRVSAGEAEVGHRY